MTGQPGQGWKSLFLENVLGFSSFSFLGLMYEDRTQNYDQKFAKNISHMIHPFPCYMAIV